MRAYITAPFKREENQTKIKEICDIVKQSGLEDFCFVRDMQKFESAFSDAQILMRMAKEEVMKCDILFIEASEKTTTGCTIETGMAYAMGKKIVTIAKFGSNISHTLRGISNIILEYNELSDIIYPLKKYLSIK